MKLISFLTVLFFFMLAACKFKWQSKGEQYLKIDQSVLVNHIGAQKECIIISCNRCSCFDRQFEQMNKEQVDYLQQFPILKDTLCGKLPLKFIYISQNSIDSVSDDMYNVTLIKQRDGEFIGRVIKQEESIKMIKICKHFFDAD